MKLLTLQAEQLWWLWLTRKYKHVKKGEKCELSGLPLDTCLQFDDVELYYHYITSRPITSKHG